MRIQIASHCFVEPKLHYSEWGAIQDAFNEGRLLQAEVPIHPLDLNAKMRKWLAKRDIVCRAYYRVLDFGKTSIGVLPAYSYGAFVEVPTEHVLMFKLTWGGV